MGQKTLKKILITISSNQKRKIKIKDETLYKIIHLIGEDIPPIEKAYVMTEIKAKVI